MRKIIALLACLWALYAGATNITNYPVRTTFNSAYWFLLSDVTAQTNWNLPGNYVASTTDLNNASNILYQLTLTNVFILNSNNIITGTSNYFQGDTTFEGDTFEAGDVYINNGFFTNPPVIFGLDPSSLVATDPLLQLYSVINGTGLLTNNGAGTFGWMPLSDLTNFSNTIITNFASITVTNPITNLSLTANTIVKSDANRALASVANGTGALTNNNAGTFGWFTYASLQDITNTVEFYTNTFMLRTNTIFTNNTVLVQQVRYLTNSGTMAPNFTNGYDAITTNASFVFLDPINTDATGKSVETTVKLVENSSGSPIVATPFANCIVISNSYMGVGANGATWFTFVRYGTQKTNVYANAETH